jgi:hypothetical protein
MLGGRRGRRSAFEDGFRGGKHGEAGRPVGHVAVYNSSNIFACDLPSDLLSSVVRLPRPPRRAAARARIPDLSISAGLFEPATPSPRLVAILCLRSPFPAALLSSLSSEPAPRSGSAAPVSPSRACPRAPVLATHPLIDNPGFLLRVQLSAVGRMAHADGSHLQFTRSCRALAANLTCPGTLHIRF